MSEEIPREDAEARGGSETAGAAGEASESCPIREVEVDDGWTSQGREMEGAGAAEGAGRAGAELSVAGSGDAARISCSGGGWTVGRGFGSVATRDGNGDSAAGWTGGRTIPSGRERGAMSEVSGRRVGSSRTGRTSLEAEQNFSCWRGGWAGASVAGAGDCSRVAAERRMERERTAEGDGALSSRAVWKRRMASGEGGGREASRPERNSAGRDKGARPEVSGRRLAAMERSSRSSDTGSIVKFPPCGR
jgi:hypothetical protein